MWDDEAQEREKIAKANIADAVLDLLRMADGPVSTHEIGKRIGVKTCKVNSAVRAKWGWFACKWQLDEIPYGDGTDRYMTSERLYVRLLDGMR